MSHTNEGELSKIISFDSSCHARLDAEHQAIPILLR